MDCKFNMNCFNLVAVGYERYANARCRKPTGNARCRPSHSPRPLISRDSFFRGRAELKNRHGGPHEGHIIAAGSQKAEMDQFKSGLPCAVFEGEACSLSLQDQGPESTAAPPSRRSRLAAGRRVDQSQARLRHLNLQNKQAAVLFLNDEGNCGAMARTIALRFASNVTLVGRHILWFRPGRRRPRHRSPRS